MTEPNPTMGGDGLMEGDFVLLEMARALHLMIDDGPIARMDFSDAQWARLEAAAAVIRAEAADRIEALTSETERLRPIPSEFEEMFGVVYRTGPPTETDYDEAIEALKNAREAYIFGDSMGCRVCEDSGHGANQCHHNPLLIARKWAAASRFYQCWHCGFVATNEAEAREHFGENECTDPSCIDSLRTSLTTSEALVASLKNQLEGVKEALRESEGIEPLLNELGDCLPHERRSLERGLKAIRKKVSAALAASTLDELEGGQEIGSENACQRTTPHGADSEAEPSAAIEFSPTAKRRAFDLIEPDLGPAMELEEIDALRRKHRAENGND